jgi:16S rRNA processing protein RimM
MDKKDFYFLGKITKTSGYKGNLMFFFDVDNLDDYKELEAVFIEVNQELIPFAINYMVFKSGHSAMVKLEDVDDEEQALSLVGSNLYLPVKFLPPLTGNNFYYHEVIGFEVWDLEYGKIGNISYVYDQGSQALFSIMTDNQKEILIPVMDEMILKVDRCNQRIEVSTPEGLIDIYRQ